MDEKLEYKKLFKKFCQPKQTPEIVELPDIQVLAVEGNGSPESNDFQNAVQALYGSFYTIKFGRKKAGLGPDFSGGPLEGLWWMGDNTGFDQTKRDEWQWKVLLWIPDFISKTDLDTAIAALKKKKPNPALEQVRLEKFEEGKAAQVMHIGPYSAEEPTITLLHKFVEQQGYKLRDKHHEIYLGDPRRSAPEKLKTIIRHPITKA